MKKQLRKILGAALYLCVVAAVILAVERFVPRPVVVGVIDTGISPQAIRDDRILVGANYVDPAKSTNDTYGHGSAVASVILATAPDAQLVPLVSNVYDNGKFQQVDSATLAQMIVDAVDEYDCRIINLSAGLMLDKQVIRDAVAYAEEKGVLVVASVGNDYEIQGEMMYYPAGYDSVLAVGSADRKGREISAFSQRGAWVDLYACGEAVTIRTLTGNSRESDGTSYSAAYVTAYAARLLGKDSTLSAQQLRQMILSAADTMPDGSKFLP